MSILRNNQNYFVKILAYENTEQKTNNILNNFVKIYIFY